MDAKLIAVIVIAAAVALVLFYAVSGAPGGEATAVKNAAQALPGMVGGC